MRRITVTPGPKTKRAPRTEYITDDPDEVEVVLKANGRKTLRMMNRATGLFMGQNGKWVREVRFAKRYSPAKARKFLEKARSFVWEAN